MGGGRGMKCFDGQLKIKMQVQITVIGQVWNLDWDKGAGIMYDDL